MEPAKIFSIRESQVGNVQVFHLQGNLHGNACVELKNRVSALLKQKKTRIAIDLSGLNYVASEGISALLNSQNRCRLQGGMLHLAALSPSVREVFEVLCLKSIISIHDTLDECVKAVSA